MAYLLDINVLIARVDPGHEHHHRARLWLDARASAEIATCPLTENGFVRIYGHPSYPGGPGSPAAALEQLRMIRALPNHRFVADTLSIDDPASFHSFDGIGPRQITDLYLLALAARHRMSFATFDTAVSADFVVGGPAALVVIS
jgi:toxin-antitoxin system PIN domain toxin